MSVISDPVLLDNCAISACVAAGAWSALASRYTLETVEEVEREATTGYQHRAIIPPREFREQVAVHAVSDAARFDMQAAHAGLGALDEGERDLWVHALARSDAWVLCGPDIASIKFGVLNGYQDRLVSLEQLLEAIGHTPKTKLADHQTEKWLRAVIGKIVMDEKFKQMR
jgi:hypothetical protein